MSDLVPIPKRGAPDSPHTSRDIPAAFVPIEQLLPYARNARTHSDAQVAQIAASIVEWGWTNPILADAKGIVAGHGRLAAARLLYSQGRVLHLPSGEDVPQGCVPCIDVSGWSETARRAYVLADNQLALQAGWDDAMLAEELRSIRDDGFDISLAGFDDADIALLKLEDGDVATPPGDERYTNKIVAPIYEIKGECPAIASLYDESRTMQLQSSIMNAELPDDVREFLLAAAHRHTRFHFGNIAEFYAHASPHVQRLIEESALVIVDMDRAIELGFVRVTEHLARLAGIDAEATDAAD